MARPLRLEFAGALYHITSRGDGQEAIYLSDADRHSFLEVLSDVCEHLKWQCHSYCLMGNHYHLLIETPDANLSKGMRHLNGVYTQRFNRRHQRVGHVFQGRYNAILVQKESYLLEVARYIVLNPVRAGMVNDPKIWQWSSYRATAGIIKAPRWLVIKELLAAFSQDTHKAIDRYRRFVADDRASGKLWELLKGQIYLGSDAFVEQLQRHCNERPLDEIPKSQLTKKGLPPPIEEASNSRNEAIVQAWQSGGYTMKQIGKAFDLHYSRISRIVAEEKRRAKADGSNTQRKT